MTTSKLMMVLQGQMVEAGKRIAERRKELSLTQQEVCTLYKQARTALYPTTEEQQNAEVIDTFRLSRIENGHAKGLSPQEVTLLAHVLQWPPAAIAGPEALKEGITWDPLSNMQYARDVLELMKLYGIKAQKLWGWATFLPCSLETPEFMHAHHLALFKELPEQFKTETVDKYDMIGNKRREQVVGDPAKRPYDFYQFMRLSDVIKIAKAEGDYVGFSKELRMECFTNLRKLVSEPSNRIYLVVAEDEDVKGAEKFFLDSDSRIIFDDQLMVYRAPLGNVHFTTNENTIKLYSHYYETIIKNAKYNSYTDLEGVHILISDLMKIVREEV